MTDSRDEHETYGHTESPIIARLQEQIARLTAERDEARRELCIRIGTVGPLYCKDIAKSRGWDCFTEDGK